MPSHILETADAVDTVGKQLESWATECVPVTAHSATLTSGETVRLFALAETADAGSREQFEADARQWVQYSDQAGITPVVEYGTDPLPWIAVEDGGAALSACVEALSLEEITRVVTTVGETLREIDQPHLGIRPAVVRVQRTGSLAVTLDWAIPSLCQDRQYTAPERRDGTTNGDDAGGEKADIYSLGALLWESLDAECVPADLESICATAMADDPADRYHSIYAFKRALLFDHQPPGSRTTDSQADRANPAGTERDAEAVDHADQSEPSDAENQAASRRDEDQKQATEAETHDEAAEATHTMFHRRTLIAATAFGAAGVGAVGLGQLWGTTGGDETTPPFEFSYDQRGLLEIKHTDEQEVDHRAAQVTGAGFTASPELTWETLADTAAITEDRETVVLAADPAFDIEIIDDDGEKLASETGPAAGDSHPSDRRQPIPALSFSVEQQGEALEIRYDDGPAIPGSHLTLHDRVAGRQQSVTESGGLIEPGAQFTDDDTAVLDVEWSPPYVDEAAVLAEHRGGDRPLDPQLTGVDAPQYDTTNTGYAADIQGPETRPAEAWSFDQFQTDSAGSETTVTVADGRLFVNGTHRLYALDASDGTELWRAYLGTQRILTPIVADGRVFVGSVDGDDDPLVGALDVETGTVEWTFTTSGDVLFSPVVKGGVVATGSLEQLYILDPASGEESMESIDGGQVTRSTMGETFLYAITRDEKLYAHTPDEVEWELEDVIQIAPTYADETVYVVRERELDATGGERRALAAVDGADGTVRWEVGLSSRRTLPPAVADGTVILVEGSGKIHAIEEDSGEQTWETRADGDVWAAPIIANDTLYIGPSDDSLQAYDIADGTRHWRLELPTTPNNLAVVDETLYVVGQDQQLYCFTLDEE